MPLDTYTGLTAAVLNALARPGDPLVEPAVPDMVKLFEAEARRRLRSGGNEQGTFIQTVAGESTIDLPADCGAIRAADIMSTAFGDIRPMEFLGPSMSTPLLNDTGRPRYYTLYGSSARSGHAVMRLVPVPDATYVVALNYLRDLPPLSTTNQSNWLLEAHSDAYFFGVLVEAELYIGRDERMPMWLQRRDAAFASIEKADIKARWPGGNLQIRVDFMPRRGGGAASSTTIIPIPPGAIMNLNDLDDVDTSGVTAGMGLIYQGPAAASAAWIAGVVGGGSTPPMALDDLTDVNTVGATPGTVLAFNGTAWLPQVIPGAGGVSFPLALPNGGVIDSPTGWIAVAAAGVAPLAPLDIGGRVGPTGADPGVLLRRDLTDSTGGGSGTTGHGFVDQTMFRRTGATAYASFDARVNYDGTAPFDHYVGFQSRPTFDQTGTINSVRGHDSRLSGTSTAINVMHFTSHGDEDFEGTISNTQWGLYVSEITKGATRWGIQVGNNDCRFNETTIWADGRISMANGTTAAPSLCFGVGLGTTGVFHPASTAVAATYTGVEKFRVDEAGIRVWDNTGADTSVDIRAYKSPDGLTAGNAIVRFGAADGTTASGATVAHKAYAVLAGNTAGGATSQLLVGVATAGNPNLDFGLGLIQPSTDIGMLFDGANTRVDFMSLSTASFARIAASGESFINRVVDGAHRFVIGNASTGTGAFAEVQAGNGAATADRISMSAISSGSTMTGYYAIADAGLLVTGANLSGGLAIGTNAGTLRLHAGGPINLGLTLTVGSLPSVVLGNAALPTTATAGFLYIAGGPGPPTGVPTAFTGRVPLYYDSANDQMYIYNAGWKQPKTPAAAAVVTWQ